MKLRAETILIAQDLQESSDALMSGDTRSVLSDAVDAIHKDGGYGYVLDHYGDDESGDVVYRSSGETMQAPYSMSGGNGFAKKASIDTANAMKVRGRMVYEPMQDEADHYAAMSEAAISAKLYSEVPVYERFVSKAERDSAGESDFAGKGKSFPILKREDVMAAVRSIGRAGSGNSSAATIKANIIAIAKRKGWEDELPKAWRTKKTTEAATGPAAGVKLIESAPASFVGEVKLTEGQRSTYPILMISPGTGSSAHYPAEVLKKAAEAGVFKAKTFMYWNHPTAAQEAARPEGDLDNLAAITTKDGVWMENGPKGPGVYAEAKPMADYAQKIEERAPHIGLSIRAGGTASGQTKDGKPVLASIDHVESVDYVTRAGRGGMALAESDKFTKLLESFNEGGQVDMTEAEVKELKESVTALQADNAKMKARILFADATSLAGAVLSTTSLNEAQRAFVIGSVIGTVEAPRDLPVKDGSLNATALTEAINAGAKAYSATLPATGGVRGMGGAAPVVMTETADAKAAREAREKEFKAADVRALMQLGMSEAAAKAQVGVAA